MNKNQWLSIKKILDISQLTLILLTILSIIAALEVLVIHKESKLNKEVIYTRIINQDILRNSVYENLTQSSTINNYYNSARIGDKNYLVPQRESYGSWGKTVYSKEKEPGKPLLFGNLLVEILANQKDFSTESNGSKEYPITTELPKVTGFSDNTSTSNSAIFSTITTEQNVLIYQSPIYKLNITETNIEKYEEYLADISIVNIGEGASKNVNIDAPLSATIIDPTNSWSIHENTATIKSVEPGEAKSITIKSKDRLSDENIKITLCNSESIFRYNFLYIALAIFIFVVIIAFLDWFYSKR